MDDVKFGRIFKKTLATEARFGRDKTNVGLSNELRGMNNEEPIEPINLTTEPDSALGDDIEKTSQLSNPMFTARKGVSSKINTWIKTCEKLSKEINDTTDKSWVNTLKQAYPEDSQAIATQLSKTAGQLLQATNDLRTIVNQPTETPKI